MAYTTLYTLVVSGPKLRSKMDMPFIDAAVMRDTYWLLQKAGYTCEVKLEGSKIFRTADAAIEAVKLWSD